MSKGTNDATRTCLGCRAKRPQREMLRIVGGPEGVASFDVAGKFPGRGAYVCPSLPCLSNLKAASLRHVLKRTVTLAPLEELRSSLLNSLELQFEGVLTIGRKAGKIEYGADAVANTLDSGKGFLLLTAADAADRTISRLDRIRGDVPSLAVSDRETLGRLFGRNAVSVALVTSAGMARRLELLAGRLTALKTSSYHELN